MEVMKPELVWVGERCYRKNPVNHDHQVALRRGKGKATNDFDGPGSLKSGRSNNSARAPYIEPDSYDCCDPEAPDQTLEEAEYNIEKLESGGFKSVSKIPSGLYSVIIGMKGATKKRIEAETNTKVMIPRMNEIGNIVVRGQRREDVVRALSRMDMIASQARFRREATHFLSFPLNLPEVVEKVKDFKIKVLEEFKGIGGIDESIFQEPEKIHLTIVMLMLLDPKERSLADEILQSLKEEIMAMVSKDLTFRLQGLDIMNDDPTEVNVLYAKCIWENSDAQKIADFIAAKFVDAGLGKPGRGTSVKFHATIMNTRHRQSEDQEEEGSGPRQGGGRGKPTKKDFFDARGIFKKYGDFNFGQGTVDEIHISTRHTAGPDGFYKPLAKIELRRA